MQTCSEDRRVTFGYSSFQGKRETMEDFYDAKISKVDDQMVGLFGVFDGNYLLPTIYDV